MNNKYIISNLCLLLIDIVFITFFMSKSYKVMIKKIQNDTMEVKYEYVILCYILMLIGLNYFVLPTINSKSDIKNAFLFGIVLYGVYDFVNASIFKKWDIKLMLLDIVWGGILYSISSYIYLII